MASRADTLKIAQADVATISSKLAAARQDRTLFLRPEREVFVAVLLLDRTARRLRKSFGLEEPKVNAD